MTALDSYLRGPYKEDGEFLKRLSNAIEETIPLFYKRALELPVSKETPKIKGYTWPYVVLAEPNDKEKETKILSASTHCMILFALDAFNPRGKDDYSLLLGKGFRPFKFTGSSVKTDDLRNVIVDAKRALVKLIRTKDLEKTIVKSGTYGKNDPFTLTWLAEIIFRIREKDLKELEVSPEELRKSKKKICEVIKNALERDCILETKDSEGGFSEVLGSFLYVRRLHLVMTITNFAGETFSKTSEWLEDKTPILWSYFDGTIHRQLSYLAMGDPKFDPAELAFAFEGALLLHPAWVSRSTVDKVFEALKLSRDRQPYWRPVTPFLANDRGHVLFMVSIEVANSILRSCEILDEEDARLSRFSQIEPQLRTYTTWLLGEVEEIPDPNTKNQNLVGWRTEYENIDKRGMIHLWHTSHVLVFLAHYHSLLKRKIGADGVEAAGLHISHKTKIFPNYWSDEPLRSLTGTKTKRYAVLSAIESEYIKSRENPEEAHGAPQSMLLYGPPGTGKTTVAEQMAARLKRPLIVVTVSDFLAAGAAEIENRAKGVFEVLSSQEDVIVLFDEIDQFLLDRNSDLYKDQDDVFKFMTPGMLTKLQNLREAEGCIFIIATNYYERIDSAIKRPGRIDQRFLLCIPDQAQRLILLQRFVLDLFAKIFENDEKRKEYEDKAGKRGSKFDFFTDISKKRDDYSEKIFEKAKFEEAVREEKVLEKTALFGYGDLKNLVELHMDVDSVADANSLAVALREATDNVESAVSLSAYRNRFEERNTNPYEEFFLLLYLIAETKREFTSPDMQAIHHVLDQISNFQGAKEFERLKKEYIEEDEVYDILKNRRKDILKGWKKKSKAEAGKRKARPAG
ncbi:MAG: hypothetical protein QOH63_1497 [Acidobacteriota bacterium]|jgi:hypothetical protein|nr:hypothetical protein [Acidobacteriota bacterium]